MDAAVETLVREAGVTVAEAQQLLGIREDDSAKDPLEQLVREAGLSEEEARELLGSPPPELKTEDPNLAFLHHSFPGIPEASLRVRLQEAEGDVEKATDLLLNLPAIQDAGPQNFDKLQKKKAHQLRRARKREMKVDQKRQADIALLEQLTSLNLDQSTELYDREGSEVLLAALNRQNGVPKGTVDRQLRLEEPTREQLPELRQVLGNNPSLKEISQAIEYHEKLLDRDQERASRYSHTQRAISAEAWSSVRRERRLIRELQRLKTVHGDFSSLKSSRLPNIVDLHGYSLDIAVDVAQRLVDNLRSHPRSDSVELVTGAGRHSARGVPVLKNGLRKLLSASKLRYHELEGSFIIYGGQASF